MHKDDEVCLRHMLDAAHEAVSFVDDRVRSDLENDRQLALALIKDIEIVGEAAHHISEETRLQAREIPWQEIIAMRNRLVHAYFDVNLDVVWQTVKQDLPMLIENLEKILSPMT